MADDPAIDPIEAFLWHLGELREIDPDGIRAGEIAKRIHLALSTDDILILDRACNKAVKAYIRDLVYDAPPEE